MAGTGGALVTELIPLALVITLSPLSIIPAVMVLQTPRPRPAGLAFLLGWVVALAAITGADVLLAGLVTNFDKPPRWASWVRIVIGVVLIAFGIYRFARRHRHGEPPKWMTKLTTVSPARAGVIAVVLAVVNPKVVFVCIAAGFAIGTEGLGVPGAWGAVAAFVAVAASSVALPILAYAVSGERLDAPLARLKEWMERQHAVLVAAILVVIGILVFYKGIHEVL